MNLNQRATLCCCTPTSCLNTVTVTGGSVIPMVTFHIKIKINKHLLSPMPSFAEVTSESKHRNSRISVDSWWRFISENSAQLPCYFGLVISVTDVTRKIYSVLASNGLVFTLRVCYSCTCHQRDAKFNMILLKYTALSVSYSEQV